jgi:ABC-type transport system substrate-binding protein
MAETNYWNKVLSRRISRRRGVLGAATLTASAAFIAACGGDDDDGGGSGGPSDGGGTTGSTSAPSGLLQQQPDRSGEAKQGGTFRFWGGGGSSVDAIGSPLTTNRDLASIFHNRLLKVEPGVNEPASGEKVGDAAETWEYSGDGLTLTFKIRGNLGTDPRPPLDGRNLTAQDVLTSWQRWEAESALVGDLINSANPDAPVLSASAPDDQTFILYLANPSALLEHQLTDGFYFWVMPTEANERVYDPDVEAHGAGPYFLEELLPSAHTKMVRNPNYYDAPRPYLERMEFFSIPETAAKTAQFEAKQIDWGRGTPGITGAVDNQNLLDVYDRHQDAILHDTPLSDNGPMSRFGYAPDSVFRDERLRQAVSLVNDRDALSDVFTNASKLEAAGIPIETRWATHLTGLYDNVWEDPRDTGSLGGNAKYFQYDVAEARKLLEAANALNFDFDYHIDNYIAVNLTIGDTLSSHIRDSGIINVNAIQEDYAAWSQETVYRGRGGYTGMFHGGVGFKFVPEHFAFSHFHPGPATAFWDAGMGDALFPELVQLTKSMLTELDTSARVELLKQIQSLAAKQMVFLPTGAIAKHYTLAWPWLAQAAVLKDTPGDATGFRSTLFSRLWYDESLKTS